MQSQQQITAPCELLDDNGLIARPGWAVKPYWRYNRNKINAKKHRIKEWDYYAVLSPEKGFGITFTIADLGYIGMAAVCWLDFQTKTAVQSDTLTLFPMGRLNLPPSSENGSVAFADKKLKLKFDVAMNNRILSCEAPGFIDPNGNRGLNGEIVLHQDPEMDRMVIATSWEENRRAFYYNQKINCMPAQGTVTIGDRSFDFTEDTDFGTLDWGRGNWTYRNRWYWASASTRLNGDPVGWNLGYGFSDRTPASENIVFFQGKGHKLDDITFHLDTGNYMAPWQITSNDGRFQMDFVPIVDRQARTHFVLIKSVQHQVFGHFSGRIILDDGQKLQMENVLGFAEEVLNWW